MGASTPKVIDRLVDLFTNGFDGTAVDGAPLLNNVGQPSTPIGPLTEVDPNVEVVDGRAETSDSPWVMVGTSGPSEDTDIAVTSDYMVLGRQSIDESYSIPCEVLLYGDADAQSTTRLAAYALFDRVVQIVWADSTMGGILTNGKIAHIGRSTLVQPQPDKGDGTVASIQFTVDVENRYVP